VTCQDAVARPHGRTAVRLPGVLAALSVLTLAACSSDGSTFTDTTSDTVPHDATVLGDEAVPDVVTVPQGFATVTARITEPDGRVCEVCLWLADTADERGRGLMGVTDLGRAAGMAFVYDEPILGTFYMFQTPTPLSIAWFADGGTWVGSADMEPCLDVPARECARYSPQQPYDLAIEVFAGGLDELGLVPGAVVVLIDGSEGPDCQTPSS
jgi:uncharacterized membrane protein (UPF0127 family)